MMLLMMLLIIRCDQLNIRFDNQYSNLHLLCKFELIKQN
jgi:hypothetical protein